jgi:hypothetical protein
MMPSSNRKSPPESFDPHFVAATRCALAAAGLLVLGIDPEVGVNFPGTAYLLLSLYLTSNALLYAAEYLGHSAWPATIEPCLDVGWAVTLMVLSPEPSDILTGFLFIAILVTALQWGMAPGFRLARVVTILVLSLGMAEGWRDVHIGSTMHSWGVRP